MAKSTTSTEVWQSLLQDSQFSEEKTVLSAWKRWGGGGGGQGSNPVMRCSCTSVQDSAHFRDSPANWRDRLRVDKRPPGGSEWLTGSHVLGVLKDCLGVHATAR